MRGSVNELKKLIGLCILIRFAKLLLFILHLNYNAFALQQALTLRVFNSTFNTLMHPDQKYIDALLNNDTVLLEELYERFSGKIKWMVLQNNGSETDAVDVFQDALLSIFNKAKSGGLVLTCPFEAFLYLVCKNKWMNELSKRKARKVTSNDSVGYSSIGEDYLNLAEECTIEQARRCLLNEKLAELGEGCRQLLHLSWSGKSMEEVAALLNVTYGYARKKKSECMSKLIMSVKQSSAFNALK